jgi:hydrogenase maturation protease
MPSGACPILIAACGNTMAGDDAFGPRVAEALIRKRLPATEIVNLATRPGGLLDHLPGPQLLLVVDAAIRDGQPIGNLIDLDWFDPSRPPLAHEAALSSHGVSIADEINLADRLGMLPRPVRLVACTIGSTHPGQPMHEAVQRQVPPAAHRIAAYVSHWLEKSKTL